MVMKPATCSSARSALIRFPLLPMASAISASQSIFFMPSGISISSIGAGKTARRLQEEIRQRGRFLAGKFGAARRRHAGADHLIDMLLKVLRGVEHLPRPQSPAAAHAGSESSAAPGFSPSFSRKATISCSTEIGLPVLQQAEDAVGGAQGCRRAEAR